MFEALLSPDGIARVREEVNAKRQRQAELQPAIQILSLALKGLTSQHDHLSKEIDFANASIAPIRKFPVETLSIIFQFCALQDDDAPVYLSRVCRKWREAATSPQIWSRIVIDLDDLFAEEKVGIYLERSRSTLLDVELRRPGFRDSGWRAWYQAVDHSQRWRSLEISASTYDQVNDVLDDLPAHAPNLVYTSITVKGFFFLDSLIHHDHSRLELPPDFLAYPRLRSLRLQTWALPDVSITPTYALSQLTTLHLTDTYASTFRISDRVPLHPICGHAISIFLSLCPGLETFTFDARDSVAHHSGTYCLDPVDAPREKYTLPALRHLSIIAHHLDTFAIMERIVVPGLRTAHIEPLPQYSPGLTDTFGTTWSDLLRRSKIPPLKELHVFAMATQDVVWTLERSPRLKQLRLAYCTNPALVIKALAAPYAYKGRGKPTGQIRWLCPRLMRFRFEECFRVPWKSVARLIQNRHRAYMNGKMIHMMVDLVINGHDVFEERDLNTLTSLKLRQIATLIEP